jgi:transposase-like protein
MKSTDNVSFFIGVDEHNFGGRRKDLRGRGAAGKIAVLGLLKRAGKVYTVLSQLKAWYTHTNPINP